MINSKHDKPDRGYYNYLSNGPLLAAAWFDQWYLYFLSTMYVGTSQGDTVKKQNPNATSANVICPLLLTH